MLVIASPVQRQALRVRMNGEQIPVLPFVNLVIYRCRKRLSRVAWSAGCVQDVCHGTCQLPWRLGGNRRLRNRLHDKYRGLHNMRWRVFAVSSSPSRRGKCTGPELQPATPALPWDGICFGYWLARVDDRTPYLVAQLHHSFIVP